MSSVDEDPDDECPICLDRLPADTLRDEPVNRSWGNSPCCGKKICMGCNEQMRTYDLIENFQRVGVERVIAMRQQGVLEELDVRYCPLCRCPVPKSSRDEFKLVLKRAKDGKAWAQYKVGSMYMTGEGVQKNEVEGARWLKKAAEAGNTDAMNEYAGCSRMGSGVPMSIIDAKYWYETSSEAGNIVAQHNLGKLLLSGGPANQVEAARLFRIIAEQGHTLGQCSLGGCFWSGDGVEKNIERARHWYGKAASQGHVNAMHNYASLLIENAWEKYGTNVSVYPEAMYWYRKSAAGGHEQTVTAVADLEQLVSENCANCGTGKDSCEKLLKCKKCQAAYYCGRSCQREHWQMGHKTACCWKKHKKDMVDHGSMQSDNEPRDAAI